MEDTQSRIAFETLPEGECAVALGIWTAAHLAVPEHWAALQSALAQDFHTLVQSDLNRLADAWDVGGVEYIRAWPEDEAQLQARFGSLLDWAIRQGVVGDEEDT